MKKNDGRRNNKGGARPGAGRPRTIIYMGEDYSFASRALNSVVVVPVKRKQIRKTKKYRFDVLLDAYANLGLILHKGHRRDFKEFVALALDTEDEEIYDYRKRRLDYVTNQALLEKEKRTKVKEVKPKAPWEIEMEEYEKQEAKRREKIKRQNAGNDAAIARHEREQEAYKKLRRLP